MNAVTEEIKQLKKEKNAVILAHYYVEDAVQEIADYIGDSYYLSRLATETTADVVVFCGVGFMGESAKVLNPGKKVLMPDMSADCPMAHMADIAGIEKLRAEYEDLAVVCYINSTAELNTSYLFRMTISDILLQSRCLRKNFYTRTDTVRFIRQLHRKLSKRQNRSIRRHLCLHTRNVFQKCRHWQIM